MHPCHENIPDYVNRGLVQAWDTTPAAELQPAQSLLGASATQYNGKQYMIPWDWGYGSLLYRTDKIAPADAAGWELAWNTKYSGKISLWSGASTNFEIAALKMGYPNMDILSSSQLEQRQAGPDQAEAAEQVLLGQPSTPRSSRTSSPGDDLDRLQLAGHPGRHASGRSQVRFLNAEPGAAVAGCAVSCSARTRRIITTRTRTSSPSSTSAAAPR